MSNGTNSETPRTLVPQIFCRLCASPLVQAADWSQEDEFRWKVRLWCPECAFEQTAILDRPQVTHLSFAIEEGFACLLEALAELGASFSEDAGLDLVKKARCERIEPGGY